MLVLSVSRVYAVLIFFVRRADVCPSAAHFGPRQCAGVLTRVISARLHRVNIYRHAGSNPVTCTNFVGESRRDRRMVAVAGRRWSRPRRWVQVFSVYDTRSHPLPLLSERPLSRLKSDVVVCESIDDRLGLRPRPRKLFFREAGPPIALGSPLRSLRAWR